MVNIHLFDLSGTEIVSERAQACLRETLKYQSDCVIYVWSLNNPEIQQIISESKYCQWVLKNCKNINVNLFQYLKMPILSKYGGFCFELDCLVKLDLDKVEIDRNKAYFPIWPIGGGPTICAWEPIYVPKGFDISKSLDHANNECTQMPICYNEIEVCKVFDTEDVLSNYLFISGYVFHYQSPIFKFSGRPSIQKFQFKNGNIYVEVKDYWKDAQLGVNMKFELADKEIFLKCCEQFETFKIAEEIPTEIEMTISFFNWISKFIKVPEKVKICNDNEVTPWKTF